MSAVSSFFESLGKVFGKEASVASKEARVIASDAGKTVVKGSEGTVIRSVGGQMQSVKLAPQTTKQAAAVVDTAAARSQRAIQAPLGPTEKTAAANINVQPGESKWLSNWVPPSAVKKTAASAVVVGGAVGGTAALLAMAGDKAKQVWFNGQDYYNQKGAVDNMNASTDAMQKQFDLMKAVNDYNKSQMGAPGGTQVVLDNPTAKKDQTGGDVSSVSPWMIGGLALAGLGGIYYFSKHKKGHSGKK